MTSDEVILRRQKSVDGDDGTTPPPAPRLRGQSTYLALLSSLATDLDLMLNDLRSSPNTQLIPPPQSSSSSSSNSSTIFGNGPRVLPTSRYTSKQSVSIRPTHQYHHQDYLGNQNFRNPGRQVQYLPLRSEHIVHQKSSLSSSSSSSAAAVAAVVNPDPEGLFQSVTTATTTTANRNATLFSSLAQRTTKTTTFLGSSETTSTSYQQHHRQLKTSRRLPFCGSDSVNGSDNNGLVGISQNIADINDNANEQFNSLGANDSYCADEPFEDDLQALLPNCRPFSRDDIIRSRESLQSSSDGGVLAEGETSSEASNSPPCDLGLVERLLRTHPVWFLPGIQRAGAVHLLQGKEEGNFIVRGSSQPNTMAVSVRLPPDTGPYIEHYLIQSNEGTLSLESSRFKFDSIPALIAHYAQCCDELPVQLILPRALREAKNRQQLSSLALLGQEFWRYPMANPTKTTNLGMDVRSPNSFSESGIGMTVFSANNPPSKLFSPSNPLAAAVGGIFSQAGSPSDTTSSLSSFTTSPGQNQQLMSPESVDSVVLTMSPVDMTSNNRIGIGGPIATNKLSTFKSSAPAQIPMVRPLGVSEKPSNFDAVVRPQRPTPPNTLNLAPMKTPPAPPVRWSKPLTPGSPVDSNPLANNFTVTTTVTFNVDNKSSQFVEVTSPSVPMTTSSSTFQTFAKRLSPEGECKQSIDTLSSQGSSSRWQSQSSKDSNQSQRKVTTSSEASSKEKQRRSKARKESKHYQESYILESPQVYCRSALGDKISDYEDLWTQDANERWSDFSNYRPDGTQGKRPDLLAETPTVTSLNCNLLSPANSVCSSTITPASSGDKLPTNHNNNNLSDISKMTDLLSPADANKNFIQIPPEPQPRNRLGLALPLNSEDVLKSESDVTPTAQTPVSSRSKQGSPFYAEPADALRAAGISTTILRRCQRGVLLPANHRHSEPPKGGVVRTPICPILLPADIDKMACSLDELKKKPQPPKVHTRGRRDAWPLDSSWEFMGNDEEFYDAEEQWNSTNPPTSQNIFDMQESNKTKPITIQQIIAKRLPDLNLPELVRCSTPQSNNKSGQSDSQAGRLFDTVEKPTSYPASFFNGTDSAQSDDGTVFSEPWDSSQWDSFLPHDGGDTTSDTIHLSKCRPTLCNSEDDTIMDDSTLKDNQGTLKAKKPNQKIATILRNRSIRDREILCHPRNKSSHMGGPGDSIRDYTLQLAGDMSSTFSRNIENFISCTKESREAAPQVVMRNMRQFMNGMKNYLVKHGEGNFHQEVQKARSHLKSDEFLNIDAILETVMHQLVVLPLREHLCGMFVDYYTRSGDIQLLVENVKYAYGRSSVDFGIRPSVAPPTSAALHHISTLLIRLQEAEMPLDKLELFLSVISAIFDSTGCPRGQQLGADDFLPILVYVVAKCGFYGAEIEAEFMWGLLQPALLNGEAGYYLTALCSAVHVLKSFMASDNEGTGSLDWRSSTLPACSSVLRVIIPDEYNGSLQTRTLPVRPHTTTREVCRIIAHKARITNPQDFGLFKLVDGEETLLIDTECPQDARIAARGKHCMLAYKRIDAKIAWPTAAQPPYA